MSDEVLVREWTARLNLRTCSRLTLQEQNGRHFNGLDWRMQESRCNRRPPGYDLWIQVWQCQHADITTQVAIMFDAIN